MERTDLREKAASSVKWTAAAEMVTRFLQPVTAVLLARLLSPFEFGIVGLAIMVLSFSQIFWEAGLSKALILEEHEVTATANVVFWTNVLLSLIVYLLIYVSAPTVGYIYGDSILITAVIRVLSIQIIFQAFSIVQNALFQRDLNFKVLFGIRLISTCAPIAVTIPLAVMGYGVWALVWGSISGVCIQTLALWHFSRWRPSLYYDYGIARRVGRFGAWVITEGVLAWLINWADSVLLGAYLGVRDLGLYRTASMVVAMVFGLSINPVLSLFYPVFSRVQQDRPTLILIFGKSVRLLTAIAFPAAICLFLLGEPLARILFGNKWIGLGSVISFLALVQGWAWFVAGVNSEVYKAAGRPDINPKIMAFTILYYLPVYALAAPKGLHTFLWARLLVGFVSLPIHIMILSKVLNLSPFFLWYQSRAAWIAGAIMAVAILAIKVDIIMPSSSLIFELLRLVTSTLAGAAIYIYALNILDPQFVKSILALSRRALSG